MNAERTLLSQIHPLCSIVSPWASRSAGWGHDRKPAFLEVARHAGFNTPPHSTLPEVSHWGSTLRTPGPLVPLSPCGTCAPDRQVCHLNLDMGPQEDNVKPRDPTTWCRSRNQTLGVLGMGPHRHLAPLPSPHVVWVRLLMPLLTWDETRHRPSISPGLPLMS